MKYQTDAVRLTMTRSRPGLLLTATGLASSFLLTVGQVHGALLSHWAFRGDLAASAGGVDGTDVNGTVFDADPFGNSGSALAIDGSAQQYVEVSGGGGLDGLQEGTIALFVKWSGPQDAACCGSVGNIIARQSNGLFSNHVIGLDSSDPASAFVTWQPYSAGPPVIIGMTPVGDGAWHHVAITWKDGEHVLYLDGVVDGTSATPGVMRSDPNIPLTIGAWSGDGGGYSTTVIDEVKVFDAVLSEEQILDLTRPLALSSKTFLTIAKQGDPIGTLTTVAGNPTDTFAYALTAGAGDVDNAKFQIAGNVLQVGAHSFSNAADAATFSVHVRATGSPSGKTFETAFVLTVRADSDADTLLDAWELRFGNDLTKLSGLGGADADGDALTDRKEFELSQAAYPAIDPTKNDTDGDTLKDGEEIAGAGTRPPTNPTSADTDGDTLNDPLENNSRIFVSATDPGTNPVLPDTDGDGFSDGREVTSASNPNDAKSLPPATLISHWKFGGDFNDSVGQNHGVELNGAGLGDDRAGAPTSALLVDGLSQQYVEVAGGGGLDDLQEGTIAFYAKWTGAQDSACCGGTSGNILARQSNGLFSNQVLGLNSSDPASALITWQAYGAGPPALTGATLVGDDVWHHIAITFQPGRHVLYLDGEVDGQSQTTGTIRTDPSVPLTIGGWIGDGAGYATATIDDVMVFAGVLSQDQVRALMTGAPPPGPVPVLTITVAGTNVTVSWPAAATGWTLKSSATLASGSWQDVPGVVNNSVTQTVNATRCYRLEK